MNAARLKELTYQAAEAPEGVAVRIDAKELAWLLETRAELLVASEESLRVLDDDDDTLPRATARQMSRAAIARAKVKR